MDNGNIFPFSHTFEIVLYLFPLYTSIEKQIENKKKVDFTLVEFPQRRNLDSSVVTHIYLFSKF